MAAITPERIMAQLRLALLGDCGCQTTLARLANAAQSHGMTGAEIDTALQGRSFEARSDAVLAYACAIKSGEEAAIAVARARAARLGLTEAEIDGVGTAARAIIAGARQ